MDNSQYPVNTFIFEPPIFTEEDLIGLGVENYNPQKHEYGQNVFEARKIVGGKIGITVSEDDFTDFEKEQRLYYIDGVPYEAFAMVVKVNDKPVQTNGIAVKIEHLFISSQDFEKLKGAAGALGKVHKGSSNIVPLNNENLKKIETATKITARNAKFSKKGIEENKRKEQERWAPFLSITLEIINESKDKKEKFEALSLAIKTYKRAKTREISITKKVKGKEIDITEKDFVSTYRRKLAENPKKYYPEDLKTIKKEILKRLKRRKAKK